MILLQQTDGIASLVSSLLPFVLIIAVFYFLILRPQQKRQKERQKLLEGVKKGDKIITSSGIHGSVEGVEDDSILVKIADNVKVKMDKSAIGTIVGLTDTAKK
ncbi:MAG: preprotein translocase subunit YajC [Ignavibacteria bacterium]|nr:preprotein translocase subunit YajC [Ignavibacteria bacterium]